MPTTGWRELKMKGIPKGFPFVITGSIRPVKVVQTGFYRNVLPDRGLHLPF